MKTKEEIKGMLFATLWELQSRSLSETMTQQLKTKLSVLYDILGDDVPEEYWEQIEEFVN